MKASASKKGQITVLSILISVLSVFFVIGGSLVIYYFSKGYRFSIPGREFKKTGVLTVETEPTLAQLYINGNSIGRTPRGRTLDVGLHNISVWKNGYREWKKEIEVQEEKATFIYPYLVLEEILPNTVWEEDSGATLEKYWINKEKTHFVFLTSHPSDEEQKSTTYSLWSYRINTPIWDLNLNPTVIVPLLTDSIDLELSDNGQRAVISIEKKKGTERYLIDLTKATSQDKLQPIEIPNLSSYNIVWSKDNKHLILESETEILSLDTATPLLNQKPSLLVEKEEKSVLWNTDEEGFFYLLEVSNIPEDPYYVYSLKQARADGNNPKYTIEGAYFFKEKEYIQHYRDSEDIFPEFKNSPTSTQSIGQITYFEVNQTLNGIYIATNTSVYWYNINTDRYRMICAHPAQLISFSPDARKVLFVNDDYFYVFTLETEDGNHMERIGTEKVKGFVNDEVTDVAWLSNSMYLYYRKDNTLYLSEKDGGNSTELLELDNILLYTIRKNREYIVTVELSEENTIQIKQYRLK